MATETKQRWWRRRKTGDVESRTLTKETLPGAFFSEGVGQDEVGIRESLSLADVFAATRAIAQGCAACPMYVYSESATGAKTRVRGGGTEALLTRPAPGVTKPELVMTLAAHLVLWNECFIGKYKGPDRSVEQLAALAPDRMGVEEVFGEPRFTYYAPDGSVESTLTLDDVIHVKAFSVGEREMRGVSPIRKARESLALAKAITESGAATFANGTAPSGILTVPAGPEAEEQAKNLAKGFERRHAGAGNSGRIAVLTGEVGFQAVSMSLADAQWVASRNLSTVEIARLLGCQPFAINGEVGASSLTYSTVAMQMQSHVLWDLQPRLMLLAAAISADDDLCPGSLFVEADTTPLVPPAEPKTTGGETENAPDG